MGSIDLYGSDFGAPCRNVLMAARIVGLTVNEIPIDLEKGEHLTPEYLKASIDFNSAAVFSRSSQELTKEYSC